MTEPTFKRPELEDKEIISSYFEKAQSRSCERTKYSMQSSKIHLFLETAGKIFRLLIRRENRRMLRKRLNFLWNIAKRKTFLLYCIM